MKVYTRTGDGGETGLIGGTRVAKDHPRVAAYGDVDELAAVLGMALAEEGEPATAELLRAVQRDLFALGAQIADPSAQVAARKPKAAVGEEHVRRLEEAIDAREAALPALAHFILPGGGRLGALLHLARTVCRRAERSLVALGHGQRVEPLLLAYLNRLSDLLFVMARHENQRQGRPEDRWA
ncbi:MAG TPA: cob(I)yrinic acid a,c-diamide adenosyltransferase [Vicinamibacteria bacterium]|jgi:cob(I)alamin adenosyltransferase